jgi:23S rRNA (guanine2445-N2)-methyltransferase / 23S rRNA (guanine2069-N7)-methyltransferase
MPVDPRRRDERRPPVQALERREAEHEKIDNRGVFHEVRKGAGRFLVNFTAYPDIGLFLDHRPIRAR